MVTPFKDDSVILIERKLNQLINIFGADKTRVYEEFYHSIPNKNQKALFSLLHYEINKLITFMYSKHNGHYNADESRRLKSIIEVVQILQANLKDTVHSFILDPPYTSLLNQCKTFLVATQGSPIPNDLQVVELIDHRAIFHLIESVSAPSLSTVAYPLHHVDEGSYAHVYRYLDEQYNFPVIVKRAKKNLTSEEITRFKNEFTDLKRLDSPYVIKAYQFNENKMEYSMECADETLDKYITRMNDRLTMNDRIRLVQQLMRAFVYIHETGLLHRDISYSNIFIKQHNDGVTLIKVSDFGLAKHSDRNLTRQGTVIKGVLNDPSLARDGFENFEQRHDIYALTFVINFILSGKKNGIHIANSTILGFFERGINADINNRHPNVLTMANEFQRIIPTLRQLKVDKL